MAARDENRCTYVYVDSEKNRALSRVGLQCPSAKVNGTGRCRRHGGANPLVINKARRDNYENQLRSEMELFTEIWPEEHELLDPFSLLLWDIRRCGHRIDWFDRQLAKLDDEKALWWGKVKEENIGAAEFVGTNKTFEARENVILSMQNKERDRLNRLTKEWQDNRFESARIAGYGAFGLAMRRAIMALAEEFGIDLTHEEVVARVRRVIGEQPDPHAAIEPPDRHKA